MRRRFFVFGIEPHAIFFGALSQTPSAFLKESGAKNLILLIKQISYVCVKDIK